MEDSIVSILVLIDICKIIFIVAVIWRSITTYHQKNNIVRYFYIILVIIDTWYSIPQNACSKVF